MKYLALFLGVFMLAQGVYMIHRAWRTETVADRTIAAIELAQTLDPPERVAARIESLEARKAVLAGRLAAARDASASFDAALEDALARLELQVTSSGAWMAVSPGGGPAAVYERRIDVRGSLEAVLTLLHSMEAWPDRPRAREVTIRPFAPREVHASIRLAVTRATGTPAPERTAGKEEMP